MNNEPKVPGRRGFAAMDPRQQRTLASAGGRAAHASGRAHQFDSDQARAAGEKGRASRAKAKIASESTIDINPKEASFS